MTNPGLAAFLHTVAKCPGCLHQKQTILFLSGDVSFTTEEEVGFRFKEEVEEEVSDLDAFKSYSLYLQSRFICSKL